MAKQHKKRFDQEKHFFDDSLSRERGDGKTNIIHLELFNKGKDGKRVFQYNEKEAKDVNTDFAKYLYNDTHHGFLTNIDTLEKCKLLCQCRLMNHVFENSDNFKNLKKATEEGQSYFNELNDFRENDIMKYIASAEYPNGESEYSGGEEKYLASIDYQDCSNKSTLSDQEIENNKKIEKLKEEIKDIEQRNKVNEQIFNDTRIDKNDSMKVRATEHIQSNANNIEKKKKEIYELVKQNISSMKNSNPDCDPRKHILTLDTQYARFRLIKSAITRCGLVDCNGTCDMPSSGGKRKKTKRRKSRRSRRRNKKSNKARKGRRNKSRKGRKSRRTRRRRRR